MQRSSLKAFGTILTVGACVVLDASSALADGTPSTPRRILIAVGHTEGLLDESALKHASKDAVRVRDVFVQMGHVRPTDAIVLQNPDVAALSNAIRGAKSLAESTSDRAVQVFFYFSGHGDRERLHLGRELFSMSDLSAKLNEIPAQLRVVVTDACRTANVRQKGASVEPGFAISLSAPEAEGSVWLYASAEGETAQESDELKGAIFTHNLLNGLSGAADTNGDKRVTLDEAYAYAHAQTMVRSFRGSGTVQRPTAKFDVNLHAPITLTDIPGDRATVRVPQAKDIYYLVSTAPAGARGSTVVAELWSSDERATELSLPPGKYAVQRRSNGQLGYVEIAVGQRETRQLAADDFRIVPEEALSRKGQADTATPEVSWVRGDRLSLGYALTDSTHLPLLQGIGADYTHKMGAWLGIVGVEGALGQRDTAENHESVKLAGASLAAGRSFDFAHYDLRVTLGPQVRYAFQELTRHDSDRTTIGGYAATQTYGSWLPGGHLAMEGARTLGRNWVLYARVRGGAEAVRVEDRLVANLFAGGVVGVGFDFLAPAL
jgi:hypothetical protein